MVIGEAPGDHDDRSGLPFQGDAGALLMQMLRAIGVVAGESVYFANLVKCRPLGKRPPSSDEIMSCLPYLQPNIALLAPQRTLALGRVPAPVFTGAAAASQQLRAGSTVFFSE